MERKLNKCKCWSCKLSPKIKKLEKSLTPAQVKLFRSILDPLYEKVEADSTDLGVLEAKIEGVWPKNEKDELSLGEFYYRVGENLYWLKSVKIEPKS